ncbi:hypothetical protein O7607_13760 [Micromonospora sp. WMMA1949]|uniref:hypothetical protein n=1 Tax=Micromonospora sp. WMMA1949 TaxID=3015162 RepID=UPI0022B5E836|nr:hypothetical protein [Micromonospora sp. WMMA1949]MCZ7426796.1 hypothetical protein [Micromonospora sp. WMMA1949]
MTWDEDRAGAVVRRVLARVDVPPSRVDPAAVVVAARRAEQRRRRLTVTLAAATVLAIGLGSAVALGREGSGRGMDEVIDRPSPGPTETRAVPTVDQVRVRVSASPAECTSEQYDTPDDAYFPSLGAVDPSGRFLAGTSPVGDWRKKGFRTYLVIWDRGKANLVELSRAFQATVTAINSAGVAVGNRWDGENRPDVPWVYRDGQVRNLPLPEGYRDVQPVSVDAAGEILGVAVGSDDQAVLVRWDAAAQTPPRVVADHVGNFLGRASDGTVIDTVRLAREAGGIRISRPGGGTVVQPAAPGWHFRRDAPVQGDWLAGTVWGVGAEKSSPAQWNVRTGRLTVFLGLDTHRVDTVVTDRNGRLVVSTPRQGWFLVGPDGTARPIPRSLTGERQLWRILFDDAGRIYGAAFDESGRQWPVVWQCR